MQGSPLIRLALGHLSVTSVLRLQTLTACPDAMTHGKHSSMFSLNDAVCAIMPDSILWDSLWLVGWLSQWLPVKQSSGMVSRVVRSPSPLPVLQAGCCGTNRTTYFLAIAQAGELWP